MAAGRRDLDGQAPHPLAPDVRQVESLTTARAGQTSTPVAVRVSAWVRGRPGGLAGGRSGQEIRPESASTSSRSERAVRTTGRPTSNASGTQAGGTTTAGAASASVRGRAPGTERIVPSRPSSPMNAQPLTVADSSSPVATSRPTAIGRSSPAPVLRTDEGAKLTVTLRSGQGSPLESRAARTRSRASRQAVSGNPTTAKPGRPLETCTSTRTGRPRTPRRVADGMEAIMSGAPGRVGFVSAERPLDGALDRSRNARYRWGVSPASNLAATTSAFDTSYL